MKRLALATAAVVALTAAAPAFANDQLAKSLGVADQGYSLNELVALNDATADRDWQRVNVIKSGHNAADGSKSTKSYGSGASVDQLANSLGVSASDYSLNELVALKGAVDSDDTVAANAVLKKSAATTIGSDVTPARAQLASSLGMEADTPLSTLAAQKAD